MSHNKKMHVIIVWTILFFVSLQETQYNGSAVPVALSKEKQKEIEKLRAELNEGFEKTEEKSVIVQPGWTRQDNSSDAKVNSNVQVTDIERNEVKTLRAEINQAISRDTYVASVANTSAGNVHSVKQFEKQFGSKQSQIRTSVNGAEDSVGAGFDSFEDPASFKGGPNIVDASGAVEADIDIRKLQRLEVSKRRTKEVLILKFIEEDFSFNLGADVHEWEHILHDGKEYFIGRREVDLLIVHKDKDSKYAGGTVLNIGQQISYLETYSYWSIEKQQQEGVILVASKDKILWYRGDSATKQIELYWEWVVGNTISGLTYFRAESNDYLAVSSNESSRAGYYALNIYQFELHAKEFWITQRLQLQYPCGEVTVLDTGRDIMLAVVQNNSASIYTFNPRVDGSGHIRFQLLRSIESEGIEYISGFQMGGRSYLALGGTQPQILLYQQGNFIPRTILGSNFGKVMLFFPIPARTYRDDLILLVQHRVDFGTHALTVLETLIWDGEAFEMSIPVPCHLGEHIMYGASCMLDIQRDDGLKGAALLRRGDEISIIVPRHKAESGLFRLHTELLAKNSERVDLQEIFAFLRSWVKEQDDLIAEAHTFLLLPDAEISSAAGTLNNLEILQTPQLTFAGEADEIVLNNYKWTDEDSKTDLDFIINSIEQLEKDLMNSRQRREITENEKEGDSLEIENLNLNSLNVDDLHVDRVNSELFYIQDGELNFNGILNVTELHVLEQTSSRQIRQVQEVTMGIDGDLQFDEINGIPWNTIADNLVFRNMPLDLENLYVDGEVIAEDNLNVDQLNGFSFPNDFLWSSGPSQSFITAKKAFLSTLIVDAVDTEGLINGMDPLDIITLNDLQDWTGLPVFANLEISEELELNGRLHGPRDFSHLPSNPTLEEANSISAECNFQNLQVLGSIHINGKLDGTNLSSILSNVVQIPPDPAEEIIVSGEKQFSTVEFPVDFHVLDNRVNNIDVDQFVTLNTEQDLYVPTINAYIFFSNLSMTGSYDGVKIEELLHNTLKTDEPQMAPNTQLNFVDKLTTDTVRIGKRLNGITISGGFQRTDQDLVLDRARFIIINAKLADIPNDILGSINAKLNGFDLRAFLEKRTWTEPRDTGNIILEEVILDDELESDELHGIDSEQVLNFLNEISTVSEMMIDGSIQIDNIIVTGDIQLSKFNGLHFDEDIQMTVIWLNRPNYLSTSLDFIDPIRVHGKLRVENLLNSHQLPKLIEDMIFRKAANDNNAVRILATKSFLKDVHVLRQTNVSAINGLPIDEIATKKNVVNFKGSLHINGNLIANELEVKGNLNTYSILELCKLVRFDKSIQAFVLLGDIPLTQRMHLDDLTVVGHINEIENLAHFFNNILYKNNVCLLKGKNTFTGRVSIEDGAYVRSLNGYNLLALLSNIVFVGSTEPVAIKAPVTFLGATNVLNDVTVRESITTEILNGCSLKEWLADTMRVDQDEDIERSLVFTTGTLNKNSLLANYINDVNLSRVLTLFTEQNLSDAYIFSDLYLDDKIISKGLVNNVDLQEHFENTLFKNGDQNISTPLTLQTVKVLKNLQINAPINNERNLSDVATTNESPLILESPLFFQTVYSPSVHSYDLISGIDLIQWFQDGVHWKGRPQQRVTGNWSARSLNVKTTPLIINYFPNNIPNWEANSRIRASRQNVDPHDDWNADDTYAKYCKKVMKLVQRQQSRRYLIRHLERSSFEISIAEMSNDNIRQAFALRNFDHNFLLINAGCDAFVFKWNPQNEVYENFTSFKSGPIDAVSVVLDTRENSNIQFITYAESIDPMNCSYEGFHTWELDNHNISPLENFEQKTSVNKSSADGKFPQLYAGASGTDNEGNVKKNYRHLTSSTSSVSPCNFSYAINQKYRLLLRNATILHNKVNISPPQQHNVMAHHLKIPSETILKPNSTLVRGLSFADFKHVIERILSDLIYRLHIEISVTQLSIPETDLYDAQSIQDFMALVQELQREKIFSNQTALDLLKLRIPHNPAQALAVRAVQIIWPAILEIEEVHSYLREHNTTADHPICACITNSLIAMLQEVLTIAYGKDIVEISDESRFTSVIERVRKFENDLKELAIEIDREANREVQSLETVMAAMENAEDKLEEETNANILPFTLCSDPTDQLIYLEKNHIYKRGNLEKVSLIVGPESATRTLIAIASSKKHLVGGQQDQSINIYLDTVGEVLFQTIAAHRPRSLSSIRIRDETLLAFVEDCCIVRVMIYRGVEGFTVFSAFKSPVRIQQLQGLILPNSDGTSQYYISTVLRNKIIFYEFIISGLKNNATKFSLACN